MCQSDDKNWPLHIDKQGRILCGKQPDSAPGWILLSTNDLEKLTMLDLGKARMVNLWNCCSSFSAPPLGKCKHKFRLLKHFMKQSTFPPWSLAVLVTSWKVFNQKTEEPKWGNSINNMQGQPLSYQITNVWKIRIGPSQFWTNRTTFP